MYALGSPAMVPIGVSTTIEVWTDGIDLLLLALQATQVP
jgi:hypothetical protein